MMKKYLKIGDLAKITGLSVQAIRYYESKELVHPEYRSDQGYRYYGDKAVKIIGNIKYYKSIGFTLKEIRVLLTFEADPKAHCDEVQKMFKQKIHAIEAGIKDLSSRKHILEERMSHCPACGGKPGCTSRKNKKSSKRKS